MAPPGSLPTAEEIMADGEVTDEERELARRAVFECVVAAGADTTLELFDIDPVVVRDYWDEVNSCIWQYGGLYLPETYPSDRFNLGLLGVVECVEDRTGKDFGDKTVDAIGRLTEAAHATIDRAVTEDLATYEACLEYLFPGNYASDCDAIDIPDPTTSAVAYRFDGGDPQRLIVEVADCGYVVSGWLMEETPTTVTVWVRSVGADGNNCRVRHPIRLKDALGDRLVIDDATGSPVPFLES